MPVYKEIEAGNTELQESCKLENSEILRMIWWQISGLSSSAFHKRISCAMECYLSSQKIFSGMKGLYLPKLQYVPRLWLIGFALFSGLFLDLIAIFWFLT